MRASITIRFVLIAALQGIGCSSSPKASGGCHTNSQCQGGQACINSQCRSVCATDKDCNSGQICSADVCVTGTRSGAPVIDSIDGDGSVETDPTHAPHHIATALVIQGQNLQGSNVQLQGAAEPNLSVEPGATDTQLTALLPTSLVAGTYTVVVANQAGQAQQDIQVLQGEQGPPGSNADLTAQQIVSRINASSEVINAANLDAVASNDPRLIRAGNVTTIEVTAGTTRSVTINGTPVSIPNASTNGISLVVYDTTTQTVRTGTAPSTSTSFLATFDTTGQAGAINLASILTNDLQPTDVVILASQGATFADPYQDSWLAAAIPLGASSTLARRSGSDAYILVGRPGLGRGNGVEASGTTDASATALLIDSNIVSRGERPQRNVGYSRGSAAITCDASYNSAAMTPWADATAGVPHVSLRTTGGPLRVRFTGWTYTVDAAEAAFRVVVDAGKTGEIDSSDCSHTRVYNSGTGEESADCDVVFDNVPVGLHTISLQWSCGDYGSAATNPDVTLRCNDKDACTLFAEEL